ncbi:olfactory receptor 1030-like [Gymnodraco acuticeps]|uniref:Olfactory receptor 1030-like n=1 Tax=Gymnodraco acuticeps TaxID=8218 RepID=A0A6P8UXW3_GYMAC|nr:olfactory receptor 1030-like [Gymnodraco acuticeps]
MSNSTSLTVSYFILGAYLNIGYLRYLCFMITAMLYIVIVVANTSLIVVICVNRSLHEPMYLFLCSLFVNELYGSSGLFPFLLVQILSDIHTVSAPLCFLQVYSVYTYVCVEFFNLAVMSYDRYLAICCPLQYNTRMTSNKVLILIILVWLYCFVKSLMTLSLSIRLTLCGNIVNSLYCNNYLVVKLACSDTQVNNIYGYFTIALTLFVPLFPILFSYMRILRACFSGSKQTRQKAVSSCGFEVLQSRFDKSGVPRALRIILSLYFLIIQPLMNPVMYGLQMSKLRNMCKHVLRYKLLAASTGMPEKLRRRCELKASWTWDSSRRSQCTHTTHLGLPAVTNLGVRFDRHLTFDTHIKHLCKTSFYHLRNIRPTLSLSDAELVHAFVSSRLDYCNALLIGTPSGSLQKLQYVQNSAARILMRDQIQDRTTDPSMHPWERSSIPKGTSHITSLHTQPPFHNQPSASPPEDQTPHNGGSGSLCSCSSPMEFPPRPPEDPTDH